MPLDITLHVKDPRWRSRLRPCAAFVQKACNAALDKKRALSVVLADDAFVQELNRTYRGKNKPTNVLSFPDISLPLEGGRRGGGHLSTRTDSSNRADPLLNPPLFRGRKNNLGDIVLAFETVAREAKEQGKSFKAHSAHLLVHGVLHLQGHDHERDTDAQEMEALEVKILKKLNIANPYL